jgi:pyruvate/2-oxoglutarate dehydrogenase complex dihydrolipoamide acyltransferase (E2) component
MQDAPPPPGAAGPDDESGRPRLLFVRKPIGALVKGDTVLFNSFVEGVALLAFDIAWACASQGIAVVRSEKTAFDDVCQIGRNLWMLLHGDAAPDIVSAEAERSSAAGAAAAAAAAPPEIKRGARFSHGTANAFLGSAVASEMVRMFRVPSPLNVAEELRSRLLSECMTDWEVVDDGWGQDAALEPAVLVGVRRQQQQQQQQQQREAGGGGGASGAPSSEEVLRGDDGLRRRGQDALPPSSTRPGQQQQQQQQQQQADSRERALSGSGSTAIGAVAGAYDLVAGAKARWTMLRGNRS